MAWIKQFVIEDTGVQGNFWEMISINYNHRKQVSEMVIGLWINQAAYDAEKEPIHFKIYSIPSGLAPELAGGAIAFTSGYARSQPEFEGSEDA